MKIVLSTASPDLNADIDPRFGRAAYLLFVDIENNLWEAIANPGVNAPGGAGIKAAQLVAERHVEAALSGDFGPNAYEALQAAGIAMYLYGDCHTVPEAIERFRAGKLQQIESPRR